MPVFLRLATCTVKFDGKRDFSFALIYLSAENLHILLYFS